MKLITFVMAMMLFPSAYADVHSLQLLTEENKPIAKANVKMYIFGKKKKYTKITLPLSVDGSVTFEEKSDRYSISVIGQDEFKFYQGSINKRKLINKSTYVMQPSAVIQFNYDVKHPLEAGVRVGAYFESKGKYRSGHSKRITAKDNGKIEFIIDKAKKYKIIVYKERKNPVWESKPLQVEMKKTYTVNMNE